MTILKETPESLSALVCAELVRAQSIHGPMRSPHEGFAVLKEEVDELWDVVKDKHGTQREMREEAIQVAAMAMRFVLDVVEMEIGDVDA